MLEVCPTILTEDSMQAQHLGATLALYTLVKGQVAHACTCCHGFCLFFPTRFFFGLVDIILSFSSVGTPAPSADVQRCVAGVERQ